MSSKKRKDPPLRSSVELIWEESRKRRDIGIGETSEPMVVEDSFLSPEPALHNPVEEVPIQQKPLHLQPLQQQPLQQQPQIQLQLQPPPIATVPQPHTTIIQEDDAESEPEEDSDPEWSPTSVTTNSRKMKLEVEIVDLRNAKTGASEWTCPVCKKVFTDSSNFNKHALRHTTEKPAVCPWAGCGKRFTHSSTLRDHYDAIHLQVRKYKCEWPGCDKSFSNQSNKSRHMRTHNGSKPYSCHVCNKRFSQSSNLKVHLKTHDKK